MKNTKVQISQYQNLTEKVHLKPISSHNFQYFLIVTSEQIQYIISMLTMERIFNKCFFLFLMAFFCDLPANHRKTAIKNGKNTFIKNLVQS